MFAQPLDLQVLDRCFVFVKTEAPIFTRISVKKKHRYPSVDFHHSIHPSIFTIQPSHARVHRAAVTFHFVAMTIQDSLLWLHDSLLSKSTRLQITKLIQQDSPFRLTRAIIRKRACRDGASGLGMRVSGLVSVVGFEDFEHGFKIRNSGFQGDSAVLVSGSWSKF